MHNVIVQVADEPQFQKGVTTIFNNDRDNSSGLGTGTNLEYFEIHWGRVIDGRGRKAGYLRRYHNGSNLMRLNCWQELEVYALPAAPESGDAVASSTNAAPERTEPLKLQLPAPGLK